MNSGNVTRGPSLVPPTGANEMDLHELVTHIERDQEMKTQSYVVKANGWVDRSTLAYHRYVVLTIDHRSESGAPTSTYFIRIDRRAERHISAIKFVRGLGKAKSSDRVVLSYDQDRLLASSKRKEVESALRLDEPFRLDGLGLMLGVIRVEFADYKLTKENCWAMASVILELLEAEGRGTYLHGKLCFPEWAPEVRERVRNGFKSASSVLQPPDTESQALDTDELASDIEELTIIDESHPPPPLHLFGRDDYVHKITEVMKSKAMSGAGARLAIRGPGGIGKTSVALAVFHSPELDEPFPRTRRFFVACQSITTASTFLFAIASSLNVKISQGDALTLVIKRLKEESTPLMLVLDNAESFWFDHEIQPRARKILQHICSIGTITLLLTIRGTEQPNVTKWDPLPLLGPLSLPDARHAFLAIVTDLEPDTSLDLLLKMVDYVPLAVSLLARRCQITSESAATLCSRWEKEHTELLKLGGGEPDDNIDISIKLSLDSPLMRNNPNALRLLRVVSYLPAGISDEACGSMPFSGVELSTAEFLLRRLSLTYSQTPKWITTLEPIRAYMRRQHPPLADDLEVVENWHMDIANTHGNYSPGHAKFPIAFSKLTENSANISFILHAHIQQRKGLAAIAPTVLAFSYFLYWTRPNGDVLDMLLSAGTNELDQHTKGKCLRRFSGILQNQGQYREAQLKLEEAWPLFINAGDRLGAAWCLRSFGEILQMQDQYEEAQMKLEEARSQFIDIGHHLGAAQCLRSLGDILRIQDKYEEAQMKLEEARAQFVNVGDYLGATQCLQGLGDILQMLNQYEEGQLKLEEARSQFINIGDYLGAAQCLQSLGNALRMQGQHGEAQLKLEEARSQFINAGDRLGAAQCLRSLGDISKMQGQFEEARSKLQEARSQFIYIGNRLGAAQCLQHLSDILRIQNQYEAAQLMLEEVLSQFINIGNCLGAAQCLQNLGNILRMQDQYEAAQLKLEEARSQFINIGDRVGAAQCLQSLGDILRTQGEHEEARLKLEEALSQFITLGLRREAAECRQSLGRIS